MGNGRNLLIMTEDEFVGADEKLARKWLYRTLTDIGYELKRRRKIIIIAHGIGGVIGGIVGGFLAASRLD